MRFVLLANGHCYRFKNKKFSQAPEGGWGDGGMGGWGDGGMGGWGEDNLTDYLFNSPYLRTPEPTSSLLPSVSKKSRFRPIAAIAMAVG
jgi:hypothetical protein